MKAVIFAGGLGSRLSEETSIRPKPMVEIGGRPILWHIMKIYSAYGIHDFLICLGYKGYMIKEYFANFFLHSAPVVTIDLANNSIEPHRHECEPWRITLVETGANSMTGGRLKRVMPHLQDEEMFCLTYGDGVADVNIAQLIEFHQQKKKLVTLTAMRPVGKFGALQIGPDDKVLEFTEKPKGERWVNGGFFVLSPKVLPYLTDDACIWEREPLETLSREGHVAAFKHRGFWQPMDTLHDKQVLEDLWATNAAPWKIW
ncbi:MAG: glucose-1-phosphate cytidylyltransferase [Acidobacteriia bacterium]|nr:glucose-1-phosphate cytidylyltransferase [Terriglobia bacterium]